MNKIWKERMAQSSSSTGEGGSKVDEPSSESISSSVQQQQPEPTKGGDGEFVKVSRIASIQVNNAVKTRDETSFYSPKKIVVKKEVKSEPAVRIPVSRPTIVANNNNKPLSVKATKQIAKKLKKDNYNNDSDDDLSVINQRPPILPMDHIDVSPYEVNSNAELGLQYFDDLKKILSEPTNTSAAAKVFGPTNARCLSKAYGK